MSMQHKSGMQLLFELCRKTLMNAARRNNMIILNTSEQHTSSSLLRRPTFTCHDCDLQFSDIFSFLEHSYERQVFDSTDSWQYQYTEDKFCKLCLTYKKTRIDLIYHIVRHIEEAYTLELPATRSQQPVNVNTSLLRRHLQNHPDYYRHNLPVDISARNISASYISDNSNISTRNISVSNISASNISASNISARNISGNSNNPFGQHTSSSRQQVNSQFSVHVNQVQSQQHRAIIPHFTVVLGGDTSSRPAHLVPRSVENVESRIPR